MAESDPAASSDSGVLDIEERFAIVPEWLLDSEISDCAVRLYAVLLRYGQSSGARMPSRATLARRLHKKSTDTVDRAMRDLVDLGAVQVQPRYSGRERLTNLYRVRTSRPTRPLGDSDLPVPDGPQPSPVGCRISAATPETAPSRAATAGPADAAGGGRTDAATLAAGVRHDREFPTESNTPPPVVDRPVPPIAVECGIENWPAFVDECLSRRRGAKQPTARWSAPCLDAALQLAVTTRQWPAANAAKSLLIVAADPASRSPMRLAEAGPWWDAADAPSHAATTEEEEELRTAEAHLAEVGGLRVTLQRRARSELEREGQLLTRRSVCLRAYALLQASDAGAQQ